LYKWDDRLATGVWMWRSPRIDMSMAQRGLRKDNWGR